MLANRQSLPPRKIRLKVAAFAGVDPRTVEGYLLGTKQTIPPVAEAIRAALRSMGLEVRP